MNIKQLIFRLLLGAAVSAGMLAVLLYAFSANGEAINLSRLVDLLRNIPGFAILIYLLTQLIGVLLRSLRYQSLLKSSNDQTHPGLNDLIPITLVRNMTVDLLPARVGELVFVGLLKRINQTLTSHSLSCLLFATLFDIMIILPVVVLLAIFILTESQIRITLLGGALMILTGLLVVLFVLKKLAPGIITWIESVAEKINYAPFKSLTEFLARLNLAIQYTINGGQFNKVFWLTVALRIMKYGGLCMLFLGVLKTGFPHFADIPISHLLSTLIAGETAASLPIPTFLSLGSYEAGSAGVLSQFGISLANGILIMLTVHLASQIIDYSIGLMAVGWLLFRHVFKSNTVSTRSPSIWSQCLGVGFLIFTVVAFFLAFQATRQAWSVNAPPAGELITTDTKLSLPDSWSNRQGFIVWSSNRTGNHDIYYLHLPTLKITRLTDHPNTENLPKISPDGRFVVFQRGRKVWHSFRDPTPWDLVLKDIHSGTERLLVENASDPNWTPDGQKVTFRRDFNSMFSIDISNSEEQLLFKSSDLALPDNAGLQTPMLNSLGELAVTIRGPLRMTAVYKINNPIHVGQGCQVTWSPDESFVYYIDHGGKGQNLLKRYDFNEGKNKVWMDMPGDYSHEYFPKLSHDGKWLVFAASTGGHEHDTADYELFIWQVGTDPSTATRLTYHSGNDSWPDIFTN